MPASRRTILLIATAAVLLAAFAVLPAPRLIFRRSPVVSDRIAGDVRRVAMTVEPDGSMHAAVEVWTDSDWDIEYWSSITGLTPVARVVTIDLIEQRDAAIAMTGDVLALAWVDYDDNSKTYALQVATKRRIDRDWARPATVARGPKRLAQPAVAVGAAGSVTVAFVEGGHIAIATVAAAAVQRIAIPVAPGARPALIATARGPVAVYEWAEQVWLLDRRSGTNPASIQVAPGRSPAIAPAVSGYTLAWAERDAIVVRDGDQRRRIAAPGLGRGRPSIAFAGATPVAAWTAGRDLRMLKADATIATIAGRGSCCASVAASGDRAWTSWLQAQPGAAIHRRAHLRFDGPPGRFTSGDRIPVVALPASR